MTLTDQPTPAGLAARPFRFAMLIPTLAVDVAAPIATFKLLEWLGVPPIWAIAGGGLPPALNNLRIWLHSRRIEPVGILVVATIAIGTVASLISNNLFYTLIKDSFLTGAFGLVFIGSSFVGRPLMFYIIRQFVAGEDDSRNQIWNNLWNYAVFRFTIRFITVTWGLVYIAEALTRVGLAIMLPPDQVVTISPILSFGATLLLIMFTRLRMRSMRERFELMEHLRWPL
jgi:intracellular septation protein A